jgi:hypothetical protein
VSTTKKNNPKYRNQNKKGKGKKKKMKNARLEKLFKHSFPVTVALNIKAKLIVPDDRFQQSLNIFGLRQEPTRVEHFSVAPL